MGTGILVLPNDGVSDDKEVTLTVEDPLRVLLNEAVAETNTLLLKLLPNDRVSGGELVTIAVGDKPLVLA